MTTLTGPERPAASGRADSLVIFLHGYGADGNDLIGLAEPLAPHLPNTRFLAPNAPERCRNNPTGFQWFPIPWLDGSPEAVAASPPAAPSRRSTPGSTRWPPRGSPPERTVLFGFSQGTMMALQVGLRRAARPSPASSASPAGCSSPERLRGRDRLAPAGAAGARRPGPDGAVREPRARRPTRWPPPGVETYTHVSRGVGHGIAPDGLGLALGFIRDRLGRPAAEPGVTKAVPRSASVGVRPRGPETCLYLEACQAIPDEI